MPMTPRERASTTAVVLATACYLLSSLQGWTTIGYVAKPLIAMACAVLAASGSGAMRRWVIAGLGWSLAGDVALMLPGDYFVIGLALFFAAHVCYIVAFTREGWGLTPVPALAVGLYLILMVAWLLPSLGTMRLPVVAYAAVISLMAWQAIERAVARPATSARLVAFGAAMFVVSDTTLAVNRFVAPVPLERLLVMGTYALAQWSIARGSARL